MRSRGAIGHRHRAPWGARCALAHAPPELPRRARRV